MKVSRPVLYTALAGAAAYAAVLYTQPDTPTPKHKPTVRSASTTQAGIITDADLKARFPRYQASAKDAFVPLVKPKRPSVVTADAGNKELVAVGTGNWALTGITVINGSRNAVVENQSTHDILFLKPGDRWNGLKVSAVLSDTLVMLNPLRKEVRMTFEQPPAPGTPAAGAPASPGTPGSPPVGPTAAPAGIGPVPPAATPGPGQAIPAPGPGGRGAANTASNATNESVISK